MQFSTLFYALTLTATTLADMHTNAVCVDSTDAGYVYNSDATVAACGYYLARNEGSEWWNTCPDCVMITDGSPHCNSAEGHIGGDEITSYCQQAGASTTMTG